jgi:SAM-dependent methyltransferase
MDAEMLARRGCRVVIATDISVGACRRAQERARRTGLPIEPVVADAERLPLRDQAVDLAFVHDGLHHLEDPFEGIREMARVGSMISITEPADAVLTQLAVRAGLSENYEDSGNRVGRLLPSDVAEYLAARGFEPLSASRYAMYYKHFPGRPVRTLSRRRLAEPALSGLDLANRLVGRVGNKMAVQAVRRTSGTGSAHLSR